MHGTLSSVGVFIVRAKGANDNQDIQINLQHGLCLALAISVPCMLAVWFSPHVLTMIGEEPVVVRNVMYLSHGLTWGLPGFIAAFSLTRVVMLVALGSMPIIFMANYVLIYGKYGFPKSGISGIGYAMGARDVFQARRMAFTGLIFGLLLTAMIAVFFICASSQLAGLFLNENAADYQAIEKMAIAFLIIAAIFQCFDGIQSVANGAWGIPLITGL